VGHQPEETSANLNVRRAGRKPAEAIVVAASTGGPQALASLFASLGPQISQVPVFVVLHMPAQFGPIVASQIERISGCPTHIAGHREVARCGHIYFAPGDQHLSLADRGLSIAMNLDHGPEVNFCRPAADVLFSSAASIYGASTVAIVLSGMGNDGCAGAQSIYRSGGTVFAQDRASSAVWGMPGAVVEAGAAHYVLPVPDIAAHVARLLVADRSGAAA